MTGREDVAQEPTTCWTGPHHVDKASQVTPQRASGKAVGAPASAGPAPAPRPRRQAENGIMLASQQECPPHAALRAALQPKVVTDTFLMWKSVQRGSWMCSRHGSEGKVRARIQTQVSGLQADPSPPHRAPQGPAIMWKSKGFLTPRPGVLPRAAVPLASEPLVFLKGKMHAGHPPPSRSRSAAHSAILETPLPSPKPIPPALRATRTPTQLPKSQWVTGVSGTKGFRNTQQKGSHVFALKTGRPRGTRAVREGTHMGAPPRQTDSYVHPTVSAPRPTKSTRCPASDGSEEPAAVQGNAQGQGSGPCPARAAGTAGSCGLHPLPPESLQSPDHVLWISRLGFVPTPSENAQLTGT